MTKKIMKIHTPRETPSKFSQRDLDRMARSLVERGLATAAIIDVGSKRPLPEEKEVMP